MQSPQRFHVSSENMAPHPELRPVSIPLALNAKKKKKMGPIAKNTRGFMSQGRF